MLFVVIYTKHIVDNKKATGLYMEYRWSVVIGIW